jgi:hypothetical protein
VTPRFSARRMLKEYADTAYLPAFRKPAHRSAEREGGK